MATSIGPTSPRSSASSAPPALTYGATSLPPDSADAARLLALRRGPWRIENRLHRAKDVALGEDASLCHAGADPTVMAALRDAALGLLYRAVTRQLCAHADDPAAAIALVTEPGCTHA